MEEHEIVEYLTKNPAFFERNVELLKSMSIPHPLREGNVVSLMEKQVELLRTSTNEYKQEFQTLVKVARDNETIMQRSRKIVETSAYCCSLDDLSILLDDVIRNDFLIPNYSILFFAEDTDIHIIPVSDSLSKFSKRLSDDNQRYDVISHKEMKLLFPNGIPKASSFATYPLSYQNQGTEYYLGMMAFVHEEEGYFQRNEHQLALDYFCQLFSTILIRLMI